MSSLLNRLTDIKDWMALNVLKFSENKTEIMFLGSVSNQTTINSILGSLVKHNKAAVKNLGVLFDSEFKFDK